MRLGSSKIGTTRKGIGPAYADKTTRIGIRMQDLLDLNIFEKKLMAALEEKNTILTNVYNVAPMKPAEILEEYASYTEQLRDRIVDGYRVVNDALDSGKNVLFEGAQGTLLDIDHGTYPFVTSSQTVAGSACCGAGVGPLKITSVVGVVKAYVTRVGSGPFPTEDSEDDGVKMREIGGEYGTTTGRPRRCGWFDGLLLRYSIRLNGLSELAMTKLDVLDDFDEIKICTRYEYEGEIFDAFPPHQSIIHKAVPIYETMPGWKTDISGAKTYDELPQACRDYIERLQEIAGIPFTIISVGPRRDQTLFVS
jgi:adenylosuccinate synthase